MRRTLGLASAAAAVVTGCFGCNRSASIYPDTGESLAQIAFGPTNPAATVCVLNRLIVGPTGNVAAWRSSASDALSTVSSGDPTFLHLFVKNSPQTGFRVLGPLNVEPLQWSDDGSNLYVRLGERSIVNINVTTRKSEDVFRLDDVWKNVSLSLGSSQDVRGLNDKSLVSLVKQLKSEPGAVRFWVTISGGKVATAHMDRSYQLYLDGRPLRDIPGYAVRKFRPVIRPDGSAYASYRGQIHDEESGAIGTPVVDMGSGITSHYFTLKRIWRLASDAGGLAGFVNLHGQARVQDVSSRSANIAMLYRNPTQGMAVNIIHEDGSSVDRPICKEEWWKNKPSVELSKLNNSLAPFDIQFPSYLFTGPSNGSLKTLVIYFHGGPASSILDNPLPDAVKNMFDRSTDVLVMDYPGSTGNLGRMVAFQRDFRQEFGLWFDTMASRIKGFKRDYRRVVVVAESFGSVPALRLNRDSKTAPDRIILISPLLRLKDPSTWITKQEGVDRITQLRFEEAVFGGTSNREDFAQWLHDMGHSTDHSRLHLFFAERDKKSSPSDLRILGIAHRPEQVEVIPSTDHSSITGSSTLWVQVRRAANK